LWKGLLGVKKNSWIKRSSSKKKISTFANIGDYNA